jgi:hypothetical protein
MDFIEEALSYVDRNTDGLEEELFNPSEASFEETVRETSQAPVKHIDTGELEEYAYEDAAGFSMELEESEEGVSFRKDVFDLSTQEELAIKGRDFSLEESSPVQYGEETFRLPRPEEGSIKTANFSLGEVKAVSYESGEEIFRITEKDTLGYSRVEEIEMGDREERQTETSVESAIAAYNRNLSYFDGVFWGGRK